jgi:hypothetical protein
MAQPPQPPANMVALRLSSNGAWRPPTQPQPVRVGSRRGRVPGSRLRTHGKHTPAAGAGDALVTLCVTPSEDHAWRALRKCGPSSPSVGCVCFAQRTRCALASAEHWEPWTQPLTNPPAAPSSSLAPRHLARVKQPPSGGRLHVIKFRTLPRCAPTTFL